MNLFANDPEVLQAAQAEHLFQHGASAGPEPAAVRPVPAAGERERSGGVASDGRGTRPAGGDQGSLVAQALSGHSVAAALERLGADRAVPAGVAGPAPSVPFTEPGSGAAEFPIDRAGPAARSLSEPSRTAAATAGLSASFMSGLEASVPRWAQSRSVDARAGEPQAAPARHPRSGAAGVAPDVPAPPHAATVPRAAAIALASPASEPGHAAAPGQPRAAPPAPPANSSLQAAAGAGGPLRVSLERLAASPLGSVSATAAPVLPSALPRAQAAGATGESPAALAAVPPRAAPDVPASFTGLPSVQGSASWDAPARAQQPQTPSTALANIPASAAIASRTDAPSGLSENALEPLRALGLRQLEEIQALRRLEEQRLVGLLPAAPRGGRPVNAR